MKSKLILILLALCLNACNKVEPAILDTESSIQIEAPSSESSEEAMVESEEIFETAEQLGRVPSLKEVDADVFPFADMEYITLIAKGERRDIDDAAPGWFEYALLGGDHDTYEKGRECYETINSLYEEEPLNPEDRELILGRELNSEEKNRLKAMKRHIFCFSSDGERVLLKNYANRTSLPGYFILYEIYEGFTPVGSYLYDDLLKLTYVNYTKGLKFVNLDLSRDGFTVDVGGSAEDGSVIEFYQSAQLSNRHEIEDAVKDTVTGEISMLIRKEPEINLHVADPKIYRISRTTNPTDTMYYKKDSDNEGKECIGIYSVDDNELIYQSNGIEQGIEIKKDLKTVALLDDELIVGVTASRANSVKFEHDDHGYTGTLFDYYEIDINSSEWIYLFTDVEGTFSPDGKFFAADIWTEEGGAYKIQCLDSGNYTNIIASKEMPGYRKEVICWVKKNKINELLELAIQ